jgi:transglutaminase-like putative cysteine protease
MHLKILHTTTYHFDHPVPYGLQQLRLIPKSRAGQVVKSWNMQIDGGETQTEFNDHHQNRVTLISFDPHATSIVVHCEGEVENADLHGVIGKHGGFAPLWYFRRSTELTRAGPHVRRLAKGLREEVAEDIPRLHALSQRIIAEVDYVIGRPAPRPPPRRRSSRAQAACARTTPISSSPPRGPWATPRATSRAT